MAGTSSTRSAASAPTPTRPGRWSSATVAARPRLPRAGDRTARGRHGIRWEAEFAPARRIRPVGFVDQTWGLRLRLRSATRRWSPGSPGRTAPATASGARPAAADPAGSRPPGGLRHRGRPSRVRAGGREPVARANGRRRCATPPARPLRDGAAGGGSATSSGRVRRAHRRHTKIAVFNRLLAGCRSGRAGRLREPSRAAVLGQPASTSTGSCAAAARRAGRSGRTRRPRGLPGDATLVKRGSGRTSGRWPAPSSGSTTRASRDGCASAPRPRTCRPGTVRRYKRMGFDQPRLKPRPPARAGSGCGGWWTASTASSSAPSTTCAPCARASGSARSCCGPATRATTPWSTAWTATPSWPRRSPPLRRVARPGRRAPRRPVRADVRDRAEGPPGPASRAARRPGGLRAGAAARSTSCSSGRTTCAGRHPPGAARGDAGRRRRARRDPAAAAGRRPGHRPLLDHVRLRAARPPHRAAPRRTAATAPPATSTCERHGPGPITRTEEELFARARRAGGGRGRPRGPAPRVRRALRRARPGRRRPDGGGPLLRPRRSATHRGRKRDGRTA